MTRDGIQTELRRRISVLTEEARKNEEAWKRSKQRELELLEAPDLPVLLDRLTRGLRESYGLRAAVLALADPDHEVRHLLMSLGHRPDAFADVLFVESPAALLPAVVERSGRPWLGAFDTRSHAALFAGHERLQSVALLPLRRQRRLVGGVGLGSAEPERFHRRLATDFLSHLAAIAAFALENAVNRARLVRSGHTDVLTGWNNRRYLDSRLREELARCGRERRPLAALMIDIDHFKRINDEHGHLSGDEVLRSVAARIQAQVRASDVSARYGGEEFILLLPGTGLEPALALAERIRGAVAGRRFPLAGSGIELSVTVSIGVAEHVPAAADEDIDAAAARLVAAADGALYRAKGAGRDAVVAAPAALRRRPSEQPA